MGGRGGKDAKEGENLERGEGERETEQSHESSGQQGAGGRVVGGDVKEMTERATGVVPGACTETKTQQGEQKDKEAMNI
eukprot:764008-Hanusia_phi.AAC.2